MNKMRVRVGSRGSALALAQFTLLASGLTTQDIDCDVHEFSTAGDRKRDAKQSIERDKIDWIADIQDALLSGAIDVALHSAKDVPVEIDPRTTLIPVLPRFSAHDVLVLRSDIEQKYKSLADIPAGFLIGTSSRRRSAQAKHRIPGCEVKPLRGNVPRRLSKLNDEKLFDGILIAAAGLERLEYHDLNTIVVEPKITPPGVNQGILMAQIVRENAQLEAVLRALVEPRTQRVSWLERQLIYKLGADCGSAIGVYATIEDSEVITLVAEAYSEDATTVCRAEHSSGSGCSDSDVVESVFSSLRDQGVEKLL